jgi:drug/metabolite transporter (DMT)-like permease
LLNNKELVRPSDRALGIALVAGATVLWSTAGFFVRLLDLDNWTMQAWRSLFGALSLLAIIVGQHGRRTPQAFRAIGLVGLAAVPIATISMFTYVAALKLTTVANVAVVYATVPFIAAAVAFVWNGERSTRRTIIASAIALVGICIMVGSATRGGDLAGDALSLLMTVAFAVQLVMARRYPSLSMAPVNALGAMLCALLCWPLMPGVSVSPSQLLILAAFGTTTMGVSYLLFLTGGRRIPSGEAGLIGLLEVVLAPLWVWIGFGEIPARAAVVGGTLVLGAVVWYLSDVMMSPGKNEEDLRGVNTALAQRAEGSERSN